MAETALQIVESQSSISKPQSFAPQTFQEALVFAEQLAQSSLVPKDFQGKPANILVAIQHGAELGLPPMQSLNSIAVINGHPGIYGDAALAIVKGHRDFEWVRETFDDGSMTATCVVKRRGEPEVTQTFSKADAERAGLWDERQKIKGRDGGEMRNPTPWYCYPKRMLKFRARGFALRDAFPDALRGIVTAEEVADYPNAIEGQTVPQQTTPAQAEKVEEVIGTEAATSFYKAYKAHGWSAEESKKFLKEKFGIEAPKTSKDIPASRLKEAMDWANTNAPIREQAVQLFKDLDWTKDECEKFINEQKWNWVAIVDALSAEISKRNSQGQ